MLALNDDGNLIAVKQEHIGARTVFEDSLADALVGMRQQTVFEAVRIRRDVSGQCALVVEMGQQTRPVRLVVHGCNQARNGHGVDLGDCRAKLASRELRSGRQLNDHFPVVGPYGHIPPHENAAAHLAVRYVGASWNERLPIRILNGPCL